MDQAQEPHPTLAQLEAFDAGALPPGERGSVEIHLEGCPACCRSLDTLPEGALAALLRAFAGAGECPGPAPPAAGDEPAQPDIPAALVGHPRYRVLGVLGAGGMGVVYKAIHRLMERVVALKVVNDTLAARPGFVERFRREVKAAARLAHPNIVAAHDADEAGGLHFLVMEYVAGTSLDREVARRGPLPVRDACDYVRQAALGLQHAHERGMVHRDVKPHNLLLTPDGRVKILDFGLARVLDEGGAAAPSLSSGTFLGTPDYVAPEQARNPSGADIRADVYGLGCTLYHLLAGRPPFPAGTPLQKLLAHQECPPPPLTATRPDVPAALTRILDRMLAKDPAGRYPTPGAVAADLTALADPAAAPPARAPRRRLVPVAAALAALGALALAVFLALPALLPPPQRPEGGTDAPSGSRPDSAAPAGTVDRTRQKREVRDRAVAWLRANNAWRPDHPMVAYAASHIDKDLDASEAFQVLLGPELVKSAKATLLVGRTGDLHVFELSPALAGDVPATGCRVQNYSAGNDQWRAAPRVLLSDLAVDRADHLFPERPVTGSVVYRIVGRRPAEDSLRLTFYFGKRRRAVFLPGAGLPPADRGTLRFSFPPLGDPHQFVPGPDVVFVEVVTRDSGRVVVESNAAAAPVRVMPPEAARP
jgi:hypothetical protein